MSGGHIWIYFTKKIMLFGRHNKSCFLTMNLLTKLADTVNIVYEKQLWQCNHTYNVHYSILINDTPCFAKGDFDFTLCHERPRQKRFQSNTK